MPHSLIIGKTGYGKTTLAMKMAQSLNKQGIGIAVLDHEYNLSKWPADFGTHKPDEFLNFVETHTNFALFIDESGEYIGRYAKEMGMLATRTRHFGHSSFFILQDYKGLDKTVREQCRDLYTFKCGRKRAADLAEDFADDHLKDAYLLKKGECFAKIDDNPAYKINVFSP